MIKTKKHIPKFKTIQEEAKFWDSHDFTDYQNGFKPVKIAFVKNLSEGVTVRFDRETLQNLRYRAAQKGIGPTTLVRMWVYERLNQEGENRYPRVAN